MIEADIRQKQNLCFHNVHGQNWRGAIKTVMIIFLHKIIDGIMGKILRNQSVNY